MTELNKIFMSLNKIMNREELKPFLNIKTEFKMEASGDQANLYIYGDIGESWFGESISDVDVKDFLEENKTAKTINVYINSYGGDAFAGLAIYNQLKRHQAKVIVHIDGIAASAASLIAMAGDEINMPSTSMLMVHHAWTIVIGNAVDLRKEAERLDKVGESAMSAYMTRFTGTKEELNQLLEDESFLTAEEAVVFGFADAEVEEQEPSNEPIKNSLLAKYAANAKKPNQQQESKNILSRFTRQE